MSLLLRIIRFITISCIFFLVNISSDAALADDVVRVGGAGSGLGVLKILAETFEKIHPGIKIAILPSLGSSGGVKALLHGALDLAIIGRALNAEELREGANAVECARTPFVFIANKKVGKSDVTTRELEMIYKGQLLKWPGGDRVRLILRPAGDTDTAIVKSISKEMALAVDVSNARPAMIKAITDQEAADAVAKIPGALGGSTLVQTETEHQQVKVLSFNGVRPTLDTLAKGTYPLAKTLSLVSGPKTSAMALQFVLFVRSAQGRAILAKSGAMPAAVDKRTR